MYARLAAFVGGDVEKLREAGEARDAAGSMFPEPVRRAFVLGTPDGSQRLMITFFDSEEALEGAEAEFDRMGDEIPEEVRGTRVAREVYEVLVSWPG